MASKPKLQSVAEFQAAAEPEPEDEVQAAGVAPALEPDEEDEDTPKVPPWSEIDVAGISEVAEALNFPGVLIYNGGRAGTIDIGFEIKVRGAAVPELIARLADALGERTFTARFAGKLVGNSATVKSFRCTTDADGFIFCDVLIRLPQAAAESAGKLNVLLKRGAILALEPEQMALGI